MFFCEQQSEELGRAGPYQYPGLLDVVWGRDRPLPLHAHAPPPPVLTVHPVRGPHSLASGLESSRSRSPQDPHSKGRVFTSCSSKALPSFPRVCCYSNLLQTLRCVALLPFGNYVSSRCLGPNGHLFLSAFGGRRGLRTSSALCRKRKSTPSMGCPN